jgi:hypothetical protein
MVESYRPISLLPIMSKLLEKLLFERLQPIIENRQLIPDYQFGFRQKHATIGQIHRIVQKVGQDLEEKRYCSAAFLDITQAFDKVWHDGLLFKIIKTIPLNYFLILKSYLQERYFVVRHDEAQTSLHEIHSGVPQGSVLGPMLYLLTHKYLTVKWLIATSQEVPRFKKQGSGSRIFLGYQLSQLVKN